MYGTTPDVSSSVFTEMDFFVSFNCYTIILLILSIHSKVRVLIVLSRLPPITI